MNGGLAIELRRNGLLDEILALEDAGQNGLDHSVGALVGGNVGQAELIVELLLRHLVRTDMRDDLPTAAWVSCFLPQPASPIAPARANAVAAIRAPSEIQKHAAKLLSAVGLGRAFRRALWREARYTAVWTILLTNLYSTASQNEQGAVLFSDAIIGQPDAHRREKRLRFRQRPSSACPR